MTPDRRRLTSLTAGQAVVVGDAVVEVSPQLASAFRAGDRLLAIAETGELLHVPAAERAAAREAVDAAVAAFGRLGRATDEDITAMFESDAARLEDPEIREILTEANRADVERATARGRSTTRLVLSDSMLDGMVAGLRGWAASPLRRDETIEQLAHEGWHLEVRRAPVGVIGFVFEGRPNVFADALGVVRTGNTVVMRIGSDALGTAEAILEHVIEPALAASGLPPGTVSLVRSPAHASGWALFDDRRLALAVARGSGPAVSQLGAIARQAGTAVSLHGTGGAWVLATRAADPTRLYDSLLHSLDRKVCNTANVVCVTRQAASMVDIALRALTDAADRHDAPPRLHVTAAARPLVPEDWFGRTVTVERAGGPVNEPLADVIADDRLAEEWEWERSPELSLAVADDLDAAVGLCNRYSPSFVVSLISDDPAEHERVYAGVDAPFVGDGFTRWVDGQYALDTPELGLSNWQHGRLLGRPAILSGASVYTTRYRAVVTDPTTHR